MRRECREHFPRHHGLAIPTCVTHVPWCMPGLLTSGFLRSRWRGKRSQHSRRMRNLQFYVSGKRPMMDGSHTYDLTSATDRDGRVGSKDCFGDGNLGTSLYHRTHARMSLSICVKHHIHHIICIFHDAEQSAARSIFSKILTLNHCYVLYKREISMSTVNLESELFSTSPTFTMPFGS